MFTAIFSARQKFFTSPFFNLDEQLFVIIKHDIAIRRLLSNLTILNFFHTHIKTKRGLIYRAVDIFIRYELRLKFIPAFKIGNILFFLKS
jgi:hypothetical protein